MFFSTFDPFFDQVPTSEMAGKFFTRQNDDAVTRTLSPLSPLARVSLVLDTHRHIATSKIENKGGPALQELHGVGKNF